MEVVFLERRDGLEGLGRSSEVESFRVDVRRWLLVLDLQEQRSFAGLAKW